MPLGVSIHIPPYRLSGSVVGCLMNHPGALAALGDAVFQAPYRTPPRAPVLYIKPRNTFIAAGTASQVPADGGGVEVGATLDIVIEHSACRVDERAALHVIAGFTVVADFCLPHPDGYYRPPVRLRARDASLAVAPGVMRRDEVADPDALPIVVSIDGCEVQRGSTTGLVRPVARLLAEVTEFMTLQAGNILLLGLCPSAPLLREGERLSIEIEGVGRLALPAAGAPRGGTLSDEEGRLRALSGPEQQGPRARTGKAPRMNSRRSACGLHQAWDGRSFWRHQRQDHERRSRLASMQAVCVIVWPA